MASEVALVDGHPTITEETEVIVVTDGESDDLLGILVLLLRKICIRSILVLNHQQQKDGWNRFYWVGKLLDVFRMQNPSADQISCEECLDVNDAAEKIEHLLKVHPQCTNIFSFAVVYPFVTMQSSDLKQCQTPINVWAYGSVNFRWAARHMFKKPITIDPYDILSNMFNAPNARLRFYIFETFGAYGAHSPSTISSGTSFVLYEWIRTSDSDYARFLRDAIAGWNLISFNRSVKNIGEDTLRAMLSDIGPLIEFSFDNMQFHIYRLFEHLQKLAKANDKIRMDVDILIYVCKSPFQMVCADVGLAVASTFERLSCLFTPCTIGFADGARRFTKPTFPSGAISSSAVTDDVTTCTSRYFVPNGDHLFNRDMFLEITDLIYWTLTSQPSSSTVTAPSKAFPPA